MNPILRFWQSKFNKLNQRRQSKDSLVVLNTPQKQPSRIKIIWLFTKYQLITKTLLSIVIVPSFLFIAEILIKSTGRIAITSGDYWLFLLSFQGFGLLLLALVILLLLIGIDINSFIIMSALIQQGKTALAVRRMIIVGIQSLGLFLRPAGLMIMLYVALVMPFLGLGVTITPMQDWQIPNFITSVIYDNPVYLGLCLVILVLLFWLGMRYLFALHFIIIAGDDVKTGLTNSARLLKGRRWLFFQDFVIKGLLLTILKVGCLTLLLLIVPMIFYVAEVGGVLGRRFVGLMTALGLAEVLALVILLTTPLIISLLTKLFYQYNKSDGRSIRLAREIKTLEESGSAGLRLRTRVAIILAVAGLFAVNAVTAGVMTLRFDEDFRRDYQLAIVAHRGGGDLGAENSLDGLEQAIADGNVAWSEIDVQRTKDGHYILNHDANFQRLAGEKRTAQQMTLVEIEQLRIKNHFAIEQPAQLVPTIEQYLDLAKDKIGLFIELKGKTADQKMADDLVALVKQRQMLSEVVLLSGNYYLIKYIEARYPEVQTGYLYYFALGETSELVGDYLIMEELQATPKRVSEIQAKGKKAIVWTVNSHSSIDRFINSKVDGIITDYVGRVKQRIELARQRTDLEIILDEIFGY